MVDTTNLVSYYKLDENAANTTIADAHASNDMTASTNTSNLYDADGIINSSLNFNGTTEYAKNSISSGFDGSFTINQWIKTSSVGGFVSSFHVDSYDNYWCLINIQPTGIPRGNLYDGSNNPFVDATTAIDDGEWHMITFVRDVGADKIRIYVDGIQEGGDVTDTTTSIPSYVGFEIGEESKSRYWNGGIDEISLFDVNLGDTDIDDLWNSGNGKPYPFITDVTINPSTVTTSTTTQTPSYFIDIMTGAVEVTASIPKPRLIYEMNRGTVNIGTSTVSGRYINKNYPTEEGLNIRQKQTGTGVLEPTGINGIKTIVPSKDSQLLD